MPTTRWPDATERQTLAVCALASAIIALGPREWVSAGALGALSLALFAFHAVRSRREARAAKPAANAEPSPPPEAATPPGGSEDA